MSPQFTKWFSGAKGQSRAAAVALAGITALAVVTMVINAVRSPGPGQADSQPSPSLTTALELAITPKANAANLPVSTEVGIKLTGGHITEVALTKVGSSARIKGSLREDGGSWVPAEQLPYASKFTVKVTAAGLAGAAPKTVTTSFTTMPRPWRQTSIGMYLFDGQTVGVAMPVVLEFDPPVADSARASVQKRLFVTTTPAQPGVWHWASANQVWYRPPNYWLPGTTISVRAALGGHPMGGGSFGDADHSATVHVGSKVFLDINNKTKQMSVYANGKLIRKIPVSLGKASTPSSSGHMVIMSKAESTVFDTTREMANGYRVTVAYAMRLTWGGEFIHAAPWSVGDQGRRNVSHGCVNVSYGAAQWLYGITHVGDPVVMRSTEVPLMQGNGWTAWDLPWQQYIQGSALPVPQELTAAVQALNGTAPAAPSPSPSSGIAAQPASPGGNESSGSQASPSPTS